MEECSKLYDTFIEALNKQKNILYAVTHFIVRIAIRIENEIKKLPIDDHQFYVRYVGVYATKETAMYVRYLKRSSSDTKWESVYTTFNTPLKSTQFIYLCWLTQTNFSALFDAVKREISGQLLKSFRTNRSLTLLQNRQMLGKAIMTVYHQITLRIRSSSGLADERRNMLNNIAALNKYRTLATDVTRWRNPENWRGLLTIVNVIAI